MVFLKTRIEWFRLHASRFARSALSNGPPFAGIRRLFDSRNHHYIARPWPRLTRCRTAEKKTHLARRRGGGTTARADEYPIREQLSINARGSMDAAQGGDICPPTKEMTSESHIGIVQAGL